MTTERPTIVGRASRAADKLAAMGEVSVRYHPASGRWSAHVAYLEIGGDDGMLAGMLVSPTEHAMTPDGAVLAYLARLQGVGPPRYIILHAGESPPRRSHWRWEWDAFERLPLQACRCGGYRPDCGHGPVEP